MSDEVKILTIKQIKEDKDDGDNIKGIRGTITKLFKVRKGENYEYQNGEFKDEKGDTIEICFSKCTQPDSAKNKKVTITSVHNDQHGWLGIKKEIQSYEKDGEDKKKTVLKIVPSANIEYSGGAPSESSGGGSGSRPAGSGSGGSGQSRPDTSLHPLVTIRNLIAAHHTVTVLVNEKYGDDFDVSAKQAAVATIFIEAAKQGALLDFEKRAAAPIPKNYPPAPKDPKEWAKCVIPKGEYEGKTLADLPDDVLKKMFDYYDTHENKSVSNGAFAECVYQAAEDRGILKAAEPDPADATNAELDQPEDDIPF